LGIENALLPVFLGLLFVVVVGIFIFFFFHILQTKRRSHGVYSPQNEEFKAPIIEMTELKGLKEQAIHHQERLI